MLLALLIISFLLINLNMCQIKHPIKPTLVCHCIAIAIAYIYGREFEQFPWGIYL